MNLHSKIGKMEAVMPEFRRRLPGDVGLLARRALV
jgi:hypothetical protein